MRAFNTNYEITGAYELKEKTIVVFSEQDIKNEKCFGFGYEIAIIPIKYKDITSKYLDNIRVLTYCRCGEVIYI